MLMPGEASRPHSLATSGEVYILLSGQGAIYVDDETESVQAGDVVHIPAGARQWIENSGEEQLVFLCIVSPPWDNADEVMP
ncbi:MAG: cupin domain-containing protein [Candidatus Cloacimonetes bacterium]|nr:cupin domain-containing protein [Candidatus Cloacimonadota bacterium]